MIRKKINNKAFTLVELLVTIVLMLSILGIAILSLINASNKNKERALSEVYDQVKTAAQEYFNSNEYFINSLGNEEIAYVSVGTLVNEDYLNKTINPVSEKPLNNCDTVYYNKRSLEYCEYKSNDNEEDICSEINKNIEKNSKCVMQSPSLVVKPNTKNETTHKTTDTTTTTRKNIDDNSNPTIAINTYVKKDDTALDDKSDLSKLSRYNDSTWLSGYVFVKVGYDAGSSGVNNFMCTDTRTNGKKYNDFSGYRNVNSEGTTIIKCSLTTKSGKKVSKSVNIKLDRSAPTFDVGLYKKTDKTNVSTGKGLPKYTDNTWTNKYVYSEVQNESDELSKVDYVSYTGPNDGVKVKNLKGKKSRNVNSDGTTKITYKVCDKAGNCSSKNVSIKIDMTAPSFDVNLYKKKNENDVKTGKGLSKYENKSWYNGWVFSSVSNLSDNQSDVDSVYLTVAGASSNVTDKKQEYRNINSQGISTVKYKVCDKAGNCNSKTSEIRLDRKAPVITFGKSYDVNCISFEKIVKNKVDHRGILYIEDEAPTSLESKSNVSGIAESNYNYIYSGKSKNECAGTWCAASNGQDSMLRIARPNANLIKRTSNNDYMKIRFDFNFLEGKTATVKVYAVDNAGNSTTKTEKYSVPSTNKDAPSGYCRKLYSAKKSAKDGVCKDKEVNCYIVPDE